MRHFINIITENQRAALPSPTAVINYALTTPDTQYAFEQSIWSDVFPDRDIPNELSDDEMDRLVIGCWGQYNSAANNLKPHMVGDLSIVRRFPLAPDLSHSLGIHWSLAGRPASTHSSGEYILGATVSQDSVDWVGTFARCMLWWNGEFEITLRAGSVVDTELGEGVA